MNDVSSTVPLPQRARRPIVTPRRVVVGIFATLIALTIAGGCLYLAHDRANRATGTLYTRFIALNTDIVATKNGDDADLLYALPRIREEIDAVAAVTGLPRSLKAERDTYVITTRAVFANAEACIGPPRNSISCNTVANQLATFPTQNQGLITAMNDYYAKHPEGTKS